MRTPSLLPLWTMITTLVLAAACAEPAPEVVVAADTIVVPAELADQLVITPDTITIPAGAVAELPPLTAGRILVVAGDPEAPAVAAALRRIDAIEVTADGALALRTRPAAIGDALERAALTATVPLAPPRAAGGASDPRVVGRDLGGIEVGVGRVRLSPGNDDVAVELTDAHLRVRPDVELDLAVAGGKVQRLGAALTGELDASLTVSIAMSRGATRAFELPLKKVKKYFVQMAGPVPVVWAAEVVVGLGVEVHADTATRFELGGAIHARLDGGATWTPAGWTSGGDATFEVTPTGAGQVGAGTYDVRAYAFTKVDVQLYDAAGPYLTVRPYLAERRDQAGARARVAGVQGVRGAELAVPVFDLSVAAYEVTLFNPTTALAVPAAAGCGDLDYLGVCAEGVARWCDRGVVREVDCAASGQGCGWVSDTVGNYCTSGCGGLDLAGACSGDDVRWCEDGAVQHVACANGCGWVDGAGWYACL